MPPASAAALPSDALVASVGSEEACNAAQVALLLLKSEENFFDSWV